MAREINAKIVMPEEAVKRIVADAVSRIEVDVAAAEERGYQRAIAALRAAAQRGHDRGDTFIASIYESGARLLEHLTAAAPTDGSTDG